MKINGSDSIDIGIFRLHALDGTFGHAQKRVYMCSMVVLGHTQESMPQELDKFLKEIDFILKMSPAHCKDCLTCSQWFIRII